MEDDALKEIFRKKKEADELAEKERMRPILERQKAKDMIETNIIQEIDRWKNLLPNMEIIDEVAYDIIGPKSYYLKWRSFQMEVVEKNEGTIRDGISLKIFFQFAPSNENLLELKNRIRGFIDYIGTKV